MTTRCWRPFGRHSFRLWVPFLIVLFWQPVVSSQQEEDLPLSLLPTPEDDDDNDNIPQECFNSTQQHRYNSLTCWFYNLRVDIPKQSFTSHWITVKLQDLVCTNFSLQILNSHYQHRTASGPATLALGLANLSATCRGKYKSTGFSGHMKATIAANVADGTPDNASIVLLNNDDDATSDDPIRILWALQSDSQGNPLGLLQPSSFDVTSCRSNIAVPSLKFYGSASADVINWFHHSIKSYVQEQVSKQFCPAFTNVLNPLLNQYLARTVGFLNQHLKPLPKANHPSPPQNNNPAAVNEKLTMTTAKPSRILSSQQRQEVTHGPKPHVRPAVRWSTDAPMLATSLRVLNHFIDVHLQEGFLPRWFPAIKRLNLKTCGFFFHGINGVIRALLDLQQDQPDDDDDESPPAAVDSEVWYSLPLPPRFHTMVFAWPEVASLHLNISEIAVSGLDRWSDLSLFRLDNVHDFFETRLKTDDPVNIQIQANLNVSAAPGNNSSSILSGGDLYEEFTIDMALGRLDWNATLALWVDKDLWETKVSTGVLLDVLQGLWPAGKSNSSYVVPQEALHCLLQSILAFWAPELSLGTLLRSLTLIPKTPINPDRLDLLTESLEQDLDDLFNNALQLLIEAYPDYISSSMLGLVDGPVRHSFNDFLRSVTTVPEDGENDICPTPDDDQTTAHLLNFSQVQPLQELQEFLSHPKTLRRMNAYIQCTTDYAAHILSGMSLLPSVEDTSLTLTNVTFANIGQIVSLKLLEADEDGLGLYNSMIYGSDDDNSEMADLPHLELQLALELPTDIFATANITLFWNQLRLGGSSVLHYNVNQLKSYGLARVFKHGHCVLAPVDEFQASVVTTGHNSEGSGLLGLFAAVVNASVTLPGSNHSNSTTLEYGLSTQDYPNIHGLAEAVLEWTLDSGRDFLNLASIYSLSQASQLCSGGTARVPADSSQQNDDFNSEEAWSMALILTTMVLLAQPAIFMLRKPSNENDERRAHSVESTASITLTRLDPGMGNNEDDLYMINNRIHQTRQQQPEGLVDGPHIPALARVGLPMMMIATLFLLLSSNLSVGASVELTATLPHNRTLELPALFEFSLIQTARDMWKAKIYPVFFLIVVFSGLWPYAKLVIMLYCFVSRKVQEGTRGALLLALDALSKFSLVDTYVLVLMMVAFRYHIQFPQSDGNGEPDATMGLDVFVVPQFGFYGFLLATTLSLVAGHAAVYFHRMTQLSMLARAKTEQGSQEQKTPPVVCPRQALLCHAYETLPPKTESPGTRRRGKRLSRLAQFLLLLVWLAAVVLLGVGMTKESFVFEFGGLAGVALGDEEARRSSYSLISLGTSIPSSGNDGWGLNMLMVAYFFYAVVAPFACLYFLLLLFVLPLSVPWQWRLLQWAEIANAWSAVEVFCLSIVASLLEISSFAEFILGDRCDTINHLVQNYWPDSDDDSMAVAKCFTVHSSVDWSTAVFLIVGALLNSWIVSVSLRLVHAAMDDRLHEEWWIYAGPSEAGETQQQQQDLLSDASSSDEQGLITGILSLFFVSERDHEDEEHGHEPAQNEVDSQASPWQQRDGFVREWESDAERDPQWKEWKESQSQPSSAAGGEDGSAPQEREPSAASQ